MKVAAWRRHRLLNGLQSLILLAAMAAILSGLGWVVAGGSGVFWALVGGAALVLLNPGFSPRLVLRMYAARALGPRQAPELHALLATLAERAGLRATPELYYVPSRMLNAFAVGTRSASAVAVTDALLRALSPRELAGVLGHEVSHVRHNDMWVMGLADLFSRLTSLFSSFGQILLLLNLPLLMFSEYRVSWTAILILVFAPTLSALMQLALSRTREYDADLGAAELTGDPRGLAMALEKMERFQGRFIEQIFFPGRRVPDPSLLRTHPPTKERIRRLLALEPGLAPLDGPRSVAALPRAAYPAVERRPRWHANGMWY
ncbi:MAG: zinc metalloprotease HtpX [Gammaproteobacteria bacterium]|nr:MAG: zinc metalloprotease HtpX [Gammaproteobacteria bacterium]